MTNTTPDDLDEERVVVRAAFEVVTDGARLEVELVGLDVVVELGKGKGVGDGLAN